MLAVEQTGTLRVVEGGEARDEPLLDLRERVSLDGWEQGFLGAALHPEFASNGRLFVHYTALPDGRSVIAEYRVDPAALRPVDRSEARILEVTQPSNEHNGGQLQFGPDGYLYIALGDGHDWQNITDTSQRLDSLLGKILRIDVDDATPYAVPPDNPFVGDPDARGEIWALGFRNPWRFSFDRATGELYAADVGQFAFEEINRVVSGGNYGWPVREGTACYVFVPMERWRTVLERLRCRVAHLGTRFVPPVVEYGHGRLTPRGGDSVTGGYVYRGSDIAALEGRYLFADFLTGRIWSYGERARLPWERGPNRVWEVEELLDTELMIASFAEDARGELLLVDRRGAIFRLVAGDERP